MTEGSALAAVGTQLRTLATEIQQYLASVPEGDRYFPPIIDWHHPDEYAQTGVQGLSKFLHHVHKESAIVDALLESPSPPLEYSTNLVSLQGVWDAFKRSPRPLVGVWQTMERQGAPGSVKVDVVAAGGDEWVKVNTIKESRLMVEFREHDSYINSDYDSDSDAENGSSPGAELTNSLITQARLLIDAAQQCQRLPGLQQPRIRYVLTRLEENPEDGHRDPRIPQTFAVLRDLGIELEFAAQWGPPLPPLTRPAEAVPAIDIVLDLSVLIALCCDSTHCPLPQNEDELEARFRLLLVGDQTSTANGTHKPTPHLAPHSNATRDLRDQLQLEMTRPLIHDLRDQLSAAGITTPRFWCTREVYGRLPGLVEVIGGAAERRRAKALFDPAVGDFWRGSRWEGDAGCLTSISVTIIEDGELATHEPEMAFDATVAAVCERMIAAGGPSTPPSREPTPGPTKPTRPPKKKAEPKTKNKKDRDRGQASKNPLRPGTVFPASSRLPSGHTLRTLLAGIQARATVLTNNRGAVLKVMREAGVTDGIPDTDAGTRRARIWVVNSSSLAEWRRIEVEENNRRVLAGEEGFELRRQGHGNQS
ncbi:uncharacterized protein CcaverHIS019_0101170 [Cutaneotrichosporon cavernicola]|uniref:DUF1308 domain-containing protein n=1 Tax=Cutaneotrichosporon cavernicola TaxID=279322 RepID=A0AA48HXL9_9TREE|nr:uncharacterized protein CcaverHIS019_0101170 [Cutaneotrichosporon cavernicola]BEI87399.1 hypothetical protein CcaverHIS019_0101170 [Cutaneotrichosporon cavernicola]BEI95167.1 hypothetical protein CcaverHIS631_0101160 [Cutaneotrichosporon cavernicola]BEJ02941.1 hypothetical protein CcaverHIS641_0101160 [Cutaneotrichosporon cavernicola]